MLENRCMLLQFVGHLVNDELAVRLERIIRFSQQRPLFLNLENAKWNAGENVIARSESASLQFEWQRGCVAVDYVHTGIA